MKAQHQPDRTDDAAPERQQAGHEEATPRVQSSIEARRAAADPGSDEISGDTQESQMPQI